VTTNKRFLLAILRNEVFESGKFGTGFIADVLGDHPSTRATEPGGGELAMALALLHASAQERAPLRSGLMAPRPALLDDGARKIAATVQEQRSDRGRLFAVTLASVEQHTVRVLGKAGPRLRVEVDGVLQSVAARIDGNRVQIDNGNGVACVEEISLAPPAAAEGAGSGQLKAPMDGAIVAVNVAAGDHVEKGQVLIVLEAMKIQHQITAGVAGTVQSINVSTGTQVKSRHLLAVIEPDSAA
jgi:geranyl-CoA carboxylase alpha subunit